MVTITDPLSSEEESLVDIMTFVEDICPMLEEAWKQRKVHLIISHFKTNTKDRKYLNIIRNYHNMFPWLTALY